MYLRNCVLKGSEDVYRSLIEKRTEIIDCRTVNLDVDFFDLTKEQEQELAEYYVQTCLRLFGEEFYIAWNDDFFRAKTEKILKQSMYGHDFTVLATLKSNDVYNLKTFLKYYRELCYPKEILPRLRKSGSADYYEVTKGYWTEYFSPEACKKSILDLFRKPGMKYLNYGQAFEVEGLFYSSSYHSNKKQFKGELGLQIHQYALNDQVDFFAEEFARIATELSERYVNINARVRWTVSCAEPYWNFFGERRLQDGSHIKAECEAREWYEYYHLKSAEWFNILSPLQQSHFDNLLLQAKAFNAISVQSITTGGMIIRLNKKFSQIDVLDLYDMKKLLYAGLQPGMRSILLKDLYDPKTDHAKPRRLWEMVPIFDDEVFVLDDRVVFKHRAYPLDLNALK